LLYAGLVVTYGLLNDELYKRFLFLHSAIRILVSKCPSRHLNFAELQKFVLRCCNLYGPTFNTYNVHGILHLTNDVKRLGNLDSFSAFPYESNCKFFPNIAENQIYFSNSANRMTEIQMHGTNNDRSINSICVSMPYGVNQYRIIHFNGISLSTNLRDSCCILRDGSICVIFNIASDNNIYRLGVKKFLNVDNFYDISLVSTAFQTYKCNTLSIDKFFIIII